MGVKRAGVVASTRAALASIGKTATPMGQAALVLAARLEDPECPATAMAAMAKELRTIMTELTRTATMAKDPVDELLARRRARRGA